MREQELKLEKVKKSCNTAKKVVGIFKTIMIVASVICFVAAACVFAFRSEINTEIAKQVSERGEETVFSISDIDIHTGLFYYQSDMHELIEEGNYAEAIVTAVVCAGVAVLAFAIIFTLIQKIFKIMDNEETPFCDSVLRKIKKVFIALAVIIGLEIGIGFGAILGLVFWCIYSILDYGYALQKEVDELL